MTAPAQHSAPGRAAPRLLRPLRPLRPLQPSALRLPLPHHYLPAVNAPRPMLAAGLAVLALGCGREPQLALDKLPAITRGPAPSSVLRLSSGGGVARLYRVPSLEPSSWKAEDKLPVVERVVGADPEQGLVFSLDKQRNLVTDR